MHALEALLKRFPAPATVTAETSAMAAAFICYANDLLAHTGETASKVSLRDFATVTEHGDYGALHAEVAASIDRLLSVRLMREAGYDGKGI